MIDEVELADTGHLKLENGLSDQKYIMNQWQAEVLHMSLSPMSILILIICHMSQTSLVCMCVGVELAAVAHLWWW